VLESRDQYESEWAAMASIATKLEIGTTETLRKWVRQAEVDGGAGDHDQGVGGVEAAQA
jgi:transposase